MAQYELPRIRNGKQVWVKDQRAYHREHRKKHAEKLRADSRERMAKIRATPEGRQRWRARQREYERQIKELTGLNMQKWKMLRASVKEDHPGLTREELLPYYKELGILTPREIEYLNQRRPIR